MILARRLARPPRSVGEKADTVPKTRVALSGGSERFPIEATRRRLSYPWSASGEDDSVTEEATAYEARRPRRCDTRRGHVTARSCARRSWLAGPTNAYARPSTRPSPYRHRLVVGRTTYRESLARATTPLDVPPLCPALPCPAPPCPALPCWPNTPRRSARIGTVRQRPAELGLPTGAAAAGLDGRTSPAVAGRARLAAYDPFY
ncbi:hypothetical protein KM043_003859 [Ampulex compressa]|nr:hypothetical protein KM043_003859 [Ampulex compressa]